MDTPDTSKSTQIGEFLKEFSDLEKEKARILAQYKKYLDAVKSRKESHA